MRKKWVKVYLSREQRRLLRRIAEGLGIRESEVLHQAFHGIRKIHKPNHRNNTQDKIVFTPRLARLVLSAVEEKS